MGISTESAANGATITFPPLFEESLARVAGPQTGALLDALRRPSPVSVRWNPFKSAEVPAGRPVPWCRYGRYLDSRPSFTLDPMFHAGLYYVQEASSMFVEHIFRAVAPQGARVLDMCAAPGGKATLYSTLVGAEGLVVANEVVRNRAAVLADNIRKWGVGNTIVTGNDPSHFAALEGWFDVVAVDAPCSGEGMFRKSAEAREQWSPDNVAMCAARQRKILRDAWQALAPGGVLIYSTCTFNREENEENVAWMAENFECEDAGVEVPEDWGIVVTETSLIRGFRFYPHLVEGEGFFVAAIRKCGQRGRLFRPRARKQLFTEAPRGVASELATWVGQSEFMRFAQVAESWYGYYASRYDDIKTISEALCTLHSGVCMGELFGGKLKPDHSLAMFHDLDLSATHCAELSMEDALRYLRREEPADIDALAEGINLITCRHGTATPYALGWAKRIGPRVNNLYPKSLAILHK